MCCQARYCQDDLTLVPFVFYDLYPSEAPCSDTDHIFPYLSFSNPMSSLLDNIHHTMKAVTECCIFDGVVAEFGN